MTPNIKAQFLNYTSQRGCRHPFNSEAKQLNQKNMGKGHGRPSSDPKGAGWPSTTGNPSGGGRGNNK